MALTVQEVLRGSLQSAHQILEATMADVTDEIANHPIPGTANPVGTSYAHVVLAEDAIVNGMLQGQPPAWATTWAGRTGTDKPMPMPGMVEGDMSHWYRAARVDLAALREYAKAVFAHSEEYVGSLADAELTREIDTPFGKTPQALVVAGFVTGHCNNLCGEISAAKGVLGLKGYPF